MKALMKLGDTAVCTNLPTYKKLRKLQITNMMNTFYPRSPVHDASSAKKSVPRLDISKLVRITNDRRFNPQNCVRVVLQTQ